MSDENELPPGGDGRNIDRQLGILSGEGSEQQAGSLERRPTRQSVEPAGIRRGPRLKPPVWIWTIPVYFYVGGAAGAAAVLGAAAQLPGDRRVGGLMTRCRWLAAGGCLLSTGLLIADLGRPGRFLNMLRVFRPSSPMSVGSWVLALMGPLAGISALFDGSRSVPCRRLADAAGMASGILGVPLAGYTGVLLSTTAVPIWRRSHRALPVLFVASAVAAATSFLELATLNRIEEKVVRRFGVLGTAAELAAVAALESGSSRNPQAPRALKEGPAGKLWSTAKILGLSSLALALIPGRSRAKRVAGGILGTSAALALRFAVFQAGKAPLRGKDEARSTKF